MTKHRTSKKRENNTYNFFKIWGFNPLKLLKTLKGATSANIWKKSEKSLVEFNRTLITLASSALVLSFSLINLVELNINKAIIGLSWTFFLLVILSGTFIHLLNFLHKLTNEVIKVKAEKGEYEKGEPLEVEMQFYFISRTIMFYATILEWLFFLVAFIFMMIGAYVAL